MSKQYGFTPYQDHKDMMSGENLDLVCVLTPVSTHPDIVTDCANYGLHVLCEKPIAVDYQAAKNMLAACSRKNVKFFYGASYRFLPALIKARELIEGGAIGTPYLLRETIVGGTGPKNQKAMSEVHYPLGGMGGSGMGLVDHGVHLIDTFSWLMDVRAVSVFGRGNITGKALSTEFAHINFANGAIGQLLYNDGTYDPDLPQEGLYSWGSAWDVNGQTPAGRWQAHPGCIRVYGSKGALRIFHYANELYLFTDAGSEKIKLIDRPAPAQFALQMESFCKSIQENTEPQVTGEDGLSALKMLMGIYESQQTGALVTFK